MPHGGFGIEALHSILSALQTFMNSHLSKPKFVLCDCRRRLRKFACLTQWDIAISAKAACFVYDSFQVPTLLVECIYALFEVPFLSGEIATRTRNLREENNHDRHLSRIITIVFIFVFMVISIAGYSKLQLK